MPRYEHPVDHGRRLPSVTRVAEYDGQPGIELAATQLGPEHSPAQARRVVHEWVELLSAGPTPIEELRLTTRTPARLFAALGGQQQLRVLSVKWGDYADLGVLARLPRLEVLELRGASRVVDLAPLGQLAGLSGLALADVFRTTDFAPLGRLRRLTHLALGLSMTDRRMHVATVSWLRELRELRHLRLAGLVVDDRDYVPLLDLPALASGSAMQVRGMRPGIEELRRQPWWCD